MCPARILMYHGTDRNADPDYMKSFDIVITSYHIVMREHTECGPSSSKKVR